jgi:putative urate catabolism protein
VDNWHPRDLEGYGHTPPHPRWPGGARLALQFVLNLEEGAENTVLNGDPGSETYLHEMPGGAPVLGLRNTSAESLFDYGARVGFWRLLRLFEERGLPLTVFAAGLALELNPEAGAALGELGYEVAGHGYRWIDYRFVPEAVEREHIHRTVKVIAQNTGQRPEGWYTGRVSPNTRRLLVEEGGFLYDADSYADELPFWLVAESHPHLVIPYSLVTNDLRYVVAPGFSCGADFFLTLKDCFDLLWEEGASIPRMMSVGLHSRLSGHPSRAAALARFLDYAAARERVWICRRLDIARHWLATYPPPLT